MKKQFSKAQARGGFTLVELSIGALILTIVGGIGYSILTSSTTLLAKNVSLNSSNTTLRTVLDRIYLEISQANGMPKLITPGGVSSAIGPAAGVVFDRYLGGPYVVTNPGSNGLSAADQSVQIKLATSVLASPPIPLPNDVLCIGNSTVRPLVGSSSPATLPPSPPALQSVNVTFLAKLGTSIPWTTAVVETAFLVHRKAIVVVTVNGRNELRLYPDVETSGNTCDLNTSYVVLTHEIGNQAGDNTPFTLVTQDGITYVNVALRAEASQFNKVLATKQAKEFNTFLRVDGRVRPRNFL